LIRCLSLPALPTAWDTRVISWERRSFICMMLLNVSAILPYTPGHSTGRRWEKSPVRKASMAARS